MTFTNHITDADNLHDEIIRHRPLKWQALKQLEENNLYCIVSLSGGVFTAAGADVKTNLLFFKKVSIPRRSGITICRISRLARSRR